MKHSLNAILLLCLVIFLICCTETKEKTKPIENDGWKNEAQVTRKLKNVSFTFPSKGFAFDKKELYVKECFDAIQKNSAIIQLSEFKDSIYIRFLSTREESGIYTGQKSSGSAWPYMNTLYVVANENQKPPIKHELMHLISMLEWGYENPTSHWVNEGLGTFAGNNCNGYNVAQIYRYLMESDRLIPIELLASNFYGQSEMIGYHQSAYIVEYLLSKYSVAQLKKLWTAGFGEFKEIYGVPFSSVKKDLEKLLLEKYPKAPEIDWEQFEIGCE